MVKKRKNKYDLPLPPPAIASHTIIADGDETTPTVAMMLDND